MLHWRTKIPSSSSGAHTPVTQEKNNAAGVEVIYFSPLVPGKKSCHLRPGAGDQSAWRNKTAQIPHSQ
jgi:hypothetical protein